MAILEGFYTVISTEKHTDLQTDFTIEINANHAIFEGHFPNMPVTPGVVQLEIAKQLIAKMIGHEVVLSKMSACKYTAILNPNQTPTVVFKLNLTPNEEGIKATIIVEQETVFSKINATYTEKLS